MLFSAPPLEDACDGIRDTLINENLIIESSNLQALHRLRITHTSLGNFLANYRSITGCEELRGIRVRKIRMMGI